MILSDRDIRRRIEDGDLVIDPLDDPELQIQPASVDCRLGREFLEFQQTNVPCIHPASGPDVSKYVRKTVVGAADSQQRLDEYDREPATTVEDREEFILHPGDFVLGTTTERVEIPDDIIAHVEGRSSLGRLAVVVHASLPADEQLFLWTPEEGYGFYEIGSVVEERRRAHAVSFDPETLTVNTFPVTDHIENPRQRLYRVTLESGRQVHVTADHNLFTLDATGRVDRLPSEDAVGRAVMVPRSLPGPRGILERLDLLSLLDGDPEVVTYASDGSGVRPAAGADLTDGTPIGGLTHRTRGEVAEVALAGSDFRLPRHLPVTRELGWVLGVTIAAGTAGDGILEYPALEPTVLERVRDWFDRYDTDPQVCNRELGARSLVIRSPLWARIVERLDGGERAIPAAAWNWPDAALEGLLEGILAGHGAPSGPPATIRVDGQALVDDLMYLAARLGLSSSAGDDSRAITVRRDGPEGGDPVPTPGDLLRSLREAAGLDRAAAADRLGLAPATVRALEAGDRETTRQELRSLRDTYGAAGADTARLDRIVSSAVAFDRVVAVERTDRVEPTYDLEVRPDGRAIENFLGGRGGVFLSNTAGIVDPGYRGQITLELSNLGNTPVALEPGMRISQLTFTQLTSPAERPYGRDRGSKYQNQSGPQASRIEADHEFGGDQTGGGDDP